MTTDQPQDTASKEPNTICQVSFHTERSGIEIEVITILGAEISFTLSQKIAEGLFHTLGMVLGCNHSNESPELDYQDHTP